MLTGEVLAKLLNPLALEGKGKGDYNQSVIFF
jgi:hypothetical protein